MAYDGWRVSYNKSGITASALEGIDHAKLTVLVYCWVNLLQKARPELRGVILFDYPLTGEMIMSFKLIVAAFVLIICGVSTSGVMAQEPARPPVRVIKYQGDITRILAALPNAYGVTIGLELDAQPFHQVGLSLLDPTLPDVMNAIVQSSKKYQWREAGGTVDVWPSAGGSLLLETRISNFNAKDLSPSQAFDQLFNLPEVQANMQALNLKRRAPDVSSEKVSYNRFSVNVEGVSLREALTKIAQESGIQIWIFRTHPNGFFSISTVER